MTDSRRPDKPVSEIAQRRLLHEVDSELAELEELAADVDELEVMHEIYEERFGEPPAGTVTLRSIEGGNDGE